MNLPHTVHLTHPELMAAWEDLLQLYNGQQAWDRGIIAPRCPICSEQTFVWLRQQLVKEQHLVELPPHSAWIVTKPFIPDIHKLMDTVPRLYVLPTGDRVEYMVHHRYHSRQVFRWVCPMEHKHTQHVKIVVRDDAGMRHKPSMRDMLRYGKPASSCAPCTENFN